jgi:molybdate transport system substrate-binding protein
MSSFASILLATAFFISQAATQPAKASTELMVAGAASLKEALTEIGRNYQKSKPGVRLNFNFGSSGTLQKQIENGAPVDVFIAAADKNVDELIARKLVDRATRRNIAGNQLVLIAPRNSTVPLRSFKDVLSPRVKYIAIGGPMVPAGMRAQELFTKLGIWQQAQAKAVRGKDVREVLTQVEMGNVEAGVVYLSDAAVSRKARVIARAPSAMHKPIRYPAVVVSGSKNSAQARDFVRYLSSPSAQQIFRRFRFATAP